MLRATGVLAKTECDLSYAALHGLWLGPFKENATDLAQKFEPGTGSLLHDLPE